MVSRRDKVFLALLCAALFSITLLLFLLGRYLWDESVLAEEIRLEELSQQLGREAEDAIIDARDLLVLLNDNVTVPCSIEHLQLMQEQAVARPYIRAIGYWKAADRQCGAGFIQGLKFTPPRASRIYESGVIAWWPSEETEVGGVQLFLMRFGEHDVVIDPRLLMNTSVLKNQTAGLWVEGLLMVMTPSDAILPDPESLELGLTMNGAGQSMISHFSLGTIFVIDVVAQQNISEFWLRYLPTLLTVGCFGLAFIFLWILILLRYSRHQLSLVAELRSAITQGYIRVKYQPIVEMSSGRCIGAESLARWTRENGEVIGPDVFIPLVEEAGLATDLAIVMLKGILRDMGEHLKKHPQLSINLNLSAQDLDTDRLINQLDSELLLAGVAASSIKLEITERALVNSDAARQRIRELRQRGHKIAVDDFGTGYSNLSYLESFELDVLKIDKSFVDAIESYAVTSNVIGHVIEMAISLNLDIVAEGVESAHQVEWLTSQNVTLGQGYVFSRPLSARKFIRFHLENI